MLGEVWDDVRALLATLVWLPGYALGRGVRKLSRRWSSLDGGLEE